MTDLILMGLLLLALCFNKNMLPAVVGYLGFIIYQNTLFDGHSAAINHVIYGVIFIPCIYFATIRLAETMIVYSIFHFFVAIDYVFFAKTDTFISLDYHLIQIVLAISLIYIGTRRADNELTSDNRFAWNPNSRMVNLWNSQTYTKTRKGG